jgi:membrane protein involved in D-alanine export
MTPYTDFIYFGIALYVIIPALILGFFRRAWKIWLVIATFLMLVIQYSDINNERDLPVPGIVLVIGYAFLQWVIAAVFLRVRERGPNRLVLYTAVTLSILPLVLEKTLPAFQIESPYVFLGISYITFRSVDVLLGIQDKLIKQVGFFQYITFLLFFPAISAGPIDRYRRFNEDWNRTRTREEIIADVDSGIHRVFTGFLYKFIIAALIKRYWLDPVAEASGLLNIISYMYAYFLYLFFDFAGYSSFAIGFSNFLGIHTPENFNRPFIARDIREFWNRWHMSLSFWFRDHVYNRFTFAALKGKWFKDSQTASNIGFMLTMGLMGLWHGLALHYIVYGLYHGLLLVLTGWFDRTYKGNRLLNDNGIFWRALSIVITFHLVAFGILIFSGRLF